MNTQEHNYPPHYGADLIKSILLGLVILAAGIAIGASLTFMRLSRPTDRFGQEPEIFAEQMLGRLGRELNLSPQQRQQLDPILKNYLKTLNDIRMAVRPQIVAQLEQMNKDILFVLDDHQKQLWQRKVRRIEEQFPTFRHRGPGEGKGFGSEPGRRPRQNFGPGPDHGPRQPLGPNPRRPGRLDPPDTNEPLPPVPPQPEF
jgi:hypothetical protein